MSRLRTAVLAGCMALGIAGCGKPPPLRIAILGELNGRSADQGEASRNGALLAIEQQKGLPGLQGRPIEVLVRDATENPDIGRRITEGLVAGGVDLIIGPTTSSMADAILPITEQSGTVLISPTISAVKFRGKDDHLFCVAWSNRDIARSYARYYYGKGYQRLVAAANGNNRIYTENWLQEFRHAYEQLGGKLILTEFFDPEQDDYSALIRRMLPRSPDALLLISSAVDTARLVQQVRKQHPALPIIASEWAATEQLLELGGSAVEGVMLAEGYDRYGQSPRFLDFKASYLKRYGKEAIEGSMTGFEAATIALAALARRPPGGSLKDALLNSGAFDGLEKSLNFDRFGDITREAHFLIIRDGHFTRDQ